MKDVDARVRVRIRVRVKVGFARRLLCRRSGYILGAVSSKGAASLKGWLHPRGWSRAALTVPAVNPEGEAVTPKEERFHRRGRFHRGGGRLNPGGWSIAAVTEGRLAGRVIGGGFTNG